MRVLSFACMALGLLPNVIADSSSALGTLSAATLPRFLVDSDSADINPWHNKSADLVHPNNVPWTGRTRRYHFKVGRGKIAPDGVERPVLLVNGQFPGPAIEANWGDMIEVKVDNNIVGPNESEGTAIHWHGLRMRDSQWMDGVPSTVQCPIPPGESFTYRFRADSYGSSFWHSHYGAQYSAGIFGALIIYGPHHEHYDTDLGPVFLSDWYHADYQEVVKSVVGLPAPTTQAFSDNNLINGRMPYDCTSPNSTTKPADCKPAKYAKFRFRKGKKHLLRIMNVSSQGFQRFSIDGMKMKVITNDFVPIEPYETDMLSIGIGQRADVIVEATGDSKDAVWMRSDVSATCAVSYNGNAKAAVYYEHADTSKLPNTTATKYDDSYCGNVPLNYTVPLFKMDPPATPATVERIDIRFKANATGNRLWYVNNDTFRADYEHPILLLANAGNTSYPNPDWTVYNVGSNSSVRIVIYNYSFTSRSQHPMHFHGHDYWIVAEGTGEWDGVANLKNPARRDTFVLQPGDPNKGPGYMVMDFVTDNPGVWPLHCHLAWHVSAGLYVNILEQPEKIKDLRIPRSVYKNCQKWTGYKGVPLAPEIDSGV